MGLNPLFQVGLDVQGRTCLVLGGGDEAQDKGRRLLDAGARVVLVSPAATPALAEWAAAGRLEWRQRGFRPGDLDGAFLVLNTVRGDEETAQAVFAQAGRRGLLVNTYDDSGRSHFGMAALVAAGPLRVSISTSNASPALARRLRQDLEALFDDEFVAYLEALGRVRSHLKETVPDFEERRRLLRSLVADARLEGLVRLPPDWRRRIEAVLAGEP